MSAYWPASTCYDNLKGVFVGQGSTLAASGLTVTGAGVPLGDPDIGCQGGIGIRVGSASWCRSGGARLPQEHGRDRLPEGRHRASAQTGSSLNVKTATVTGRGPVGTAENGIEVVFGAVGTISGATVTDNKCLLPGACGRTR